MAIRKKPTTNNQAGLSLWTTLPSIYESELMEEMIAHPDVDAVRYNTGMRCDISAEEILAIILKLTQKYNKPPPLIDLKGRQLRVIRWAKPPYGPILLNHPIEVPVPAHVYLRGEDGAFTIRKIANGNEIYLSPQPKYEVGEGQSVNIVSRELRILDGYFVNKDIEFIAAAKKFGIKDFLFSFTEFRDDIVTFSKALRDIKNPRMILKIESTNGLDLVRTQTEMFKNCRYMAARDDLVIHIGNLEATIASREIVQRDREAICASRLLLGLETTGEVTLADVSDLELMQRFGYKHFMLSDGISHRHFKKATNFWAEYKKT